MRRAVISLTRSADPAAAAGYSVRLGPLAFVTPADTVAEDVGGTLEAIGAAIAEGEPRPPALKLVLPIRAGRGELDQRDAGLRLRRQVRALLNNAAWRSHGFPFVWEADVDLDSWLRIGGGTIEETDPGVGFGDFGLELRDVYLVGRPGTHRPGRRLILADRRLATVPRDTRRLLYSTDFAAQALPAQPAILPGDTVDLVASGNRPVGATALGPLRDVRRLWRTASGIDGEVLTYLPDEALLNGRDRWLELDLAGAVRVWHRPTFDDVAQPSTTERDTDPDVYLGWERAFGSVLDPYPPLAVDNGACRLIWLGSSVAQGLAIEHWDDALGRYRRTGRVVHAANVREARVVEVTLDRAIIEWRAGELALRAILQRGWWGPRLEVYNDAGQTARLEFFPDAGLTSHAAAAAPTWVRSIVGATATTLWAPATADTAIGASTLAGDGVAFTRQRVTAVQMAPAPGPTADGLASLSLADAQAVPVLIARR